MMRSLLMLLVGFAVGAGCVMILFLSPEAARLGLVSLPPAQPITCEPAREETTIPTNDAQSSKGAQAPPSQLIEPEREREASIKTPDLDTKKSAVTWRVSAIEKFVPLSDDQREQLTEKFQEEQAAREEGRESEAQTLEAIIGEENATVYRQQVQAAFERVQNEELDKEVVWMSRKLALSTQQEQAMKSAFAAVEAEIDAEFKSMHGSDTSSPQARVTRMIAENKKRVQLRSEALKNVLNPEQYSAYAETEAQSSGADMEVFHDPGQ